MPHRPCFVCLLATCILVLTASPPAFSQADEAFRLPWTLYTLPNGLQVLLQPDEGQDEVAVEFWMHAGTRHEAAGRYGLAHFFEHATPYGFREDAARRQLFRDTLTGSNARTRPDFTRYYLQAPAEALPLLLDYTAQRLGADATAITGDLLERHRTNVLREMTERANTLWAPEVKMAEAPGVFGPTHPYGHGSYGTVAENKAASVDDMRRWFRAHMRPEYTTLFVVGRFDPTEARTLIEAAFGPIPGGARPSREPAWPARAQGGRAVVVARADQPAVALSWPVAAWGSPDAPALHLLARVLDERQANAPDAPAGLIEASASSRLALYQLAGFFSLAATHDGRTDGADVAAWLQALVDGVLADGPTAEELARARMKEEEALRAMHSELGWMGSRIDLLGRGLLFTGDPDAYLRQRERREALTPKEVHRTAIRWLAAPAFVTHVHPTTPP